MSAQEWPTLSLPCLTRGPVVVIAATVRRGSRTKRVVLDVNWKHGRRRRGLRVPQEFGREELECDRSPEPGVLGPIDHVHPAAADVREEPVPAGEQGTALERPMIAAGRRFQRHFAPFVTSERASLAVTLPAADCPLGRPLAHLHGSGRLLPLLQPVRQQFLFPQAVSYPHLTPATSQ